MLTNLEFNIIFYLLHSIFYIGIFGITGRSKSYLVFFGSIEIMLLSINLQLIYISVYCDVIEGQIFTLFILLIAASEISIGLCILIIYWRIGNTTSLDIKFLSKG